jgi:predicted nucleic acid-binding protein
MEKQTKVIDASVVIKWFLDEINSDKAFKLWQKHLSEEIFFIVPELIFSEVLNALRYKKLNEEELKKVNLSLWNCRFNIEKTNKNILDKVINIASEYNFTIYDSFYIALAQIHNVELITADEELVKAPNVKLLKDLNEP